VNKHLNDHQLLSYLEDDLSPGRREWAKAHLLDCPACRVRLERLARAAADLTTTLHAVGEQVPLSQARSWEAVGRYWKRHRERPLPRPYISSFRPLLRHMAILAVLAFLVVGLAGLIHTLAVTSPTLTRATPTHSPTPPASPSPAPGPLPRSYPDRQTTPISLLVLGTDGESSTPDETDALILLCINAEAEYAFLLSIPRNLYVEVPGHGQARAGSVYGLGEQDEDARGLVLVREAISTTLGLPIQHAALMRFDGFAALIDAIGGVEVEVPHPIEDLAFPNGHGGYDPLFISAGVQHFDGALALRYARTRAVPAPGFDRSFRQQQLILAAHDRVTRLGLLPDLIAQAPTLWSAVAGNLETDLSLSDVIDLALLATSLTADDITTATLDECCTVRHTTSAGEHALLPQPDEIEALIENLLEEER
jgi:LCP family protein required for cell wall assembly